MFAEADYKIKPYKKLPYIGKVVFIENQYWVVREIIKLEWYHTDLIVTVIVQKIVEKQKNDVENELKEAKKKRFKVIELNT